MSKENDRDFEEDLELPIKIIHKGNEIEIKIGSLSFTYNKKFLYWIFMFGMITLVITLFYVYKKDLGDCNIFYMNYIKQNCALIVNIIP